MSAVNLSSAPAPCPHASSPWFKAASAAAFLVGLIVLGQAVIAFGFPEPAGLEAQIRERHAFSWRASQWLPFVGIFPAMLALFAVAVRKVPTQPGWVAIGSVAVLVWGVTELVTRAEGLFVIHGLWADQVAALTEGASRTVLLERMRAATELHTARFELISFSAVVIGVCFGAATWSGRGLDRVVSLAFFAYAILMLAFRLGFSGTASDVAYFAVRSVDRFLLGTWLWATTR